MFNVNTVLLAEVQVRLMVSTNLYWVIGGACSGKSTVCEAIAKDKDLPVYDMDAHIYGKYNSQYTLERHPAIKSWFSAKNSLAWILAMELSEFDAFNKVTNVEFLDPFAKEMYQRELNEILLVDGGITHPSVLAQVVPVEQIVCIDIDPALGRKIWHEDPKRAPMKAEVLALLDGEQAWEKFLSFDKQITETMLRESEAAGIKVLRRAEGEDLDALRDGVAGYFGF